MKILNFGSCNIDYVYSLDHIVQAKETEMTARLDVFPGGKGLNQSIALARAGAAVYHAGCIGQDGRMLAGVLSENGVDISLLQTVPGQSGQAIIQVSAEGENAIFLYPGANMALSEAQIDAVLSHFSASDMLVLQNELCHTDYIVRRAAERGMCVMLNPSPYNEQIKKTDFSALSYLVLNEVEAKDISDCEQPRDCLRYFRQHYPALKVILTLGDKGCLCFDGERELYQRAFCVKVKDTTGAGDTFTGFFAAEIARGADSAEALRTAAAAAAIAVSRNGAAPSIPTMEEVRQLLRSSPTEQGTKADDLRTRIEAYVRGHIRTATPEELAGELGYSVVYTGSLVKKLTGRTFSALLQEERCRLAAHKLLHTDAPVEEIIEQVGYKNASFFRRIFRQAYKQTPLQFRQSKGDEK